MMTSEIRPIGTFTKKIQCQPTVSVISPPIAGPIRNETPKTAPNRPRYLPRSEGVYRSATTASATGKIAPPPRPWRPRNRISCSIDWLNPDRTDAIRNRLTAKMMIGRRPKRSDSLP